MPVKSGPTSGPLTVSSHVIHEPHGIGPPLQFCRVPLMETYDERTSPSPSTSMVVVPPGDFGSYAVAGLPKAVVFPPAGSATSWLRTIVETWGRRRHAAIPSCRPGTKAPSLSCAPLVLSWNDR